MHQAKLTIEFITPCFCAGAKKLKNPLANRNNPDLPGPPEAELRVSSIAGQLRWWFRWYQRYLDGNELSLRDKGSTLLEQESKVFGSSNQDHGGQSPLRIRVRHRIQGNYQEISQKGALGGYLWHFVGEHSKPHKPKYKPSRMVQNGFLPQGTIFELFLSSREQYILRTSMQVAVLWATLGSLGARGTRAAGCMKLHAITTDCEPLKAEATKLSDLKESPEKLCKHLWSGLTPPFRLWRSQQNQKDGFTAARWLAENWWCLRVYKFVKNPQDRDPTDKRYKNAPVCREHYNIGKLDHDDVVTRLKLKQTEKPSIRRAVLGLPYNQTVPRGCDTPACVEENNLIWQIAEIENRQPTVSRLGSPIRLRPILERGKVYPAVIVFDSVVNKIFPPGQTLVVKDCHELALPIDNFTALTKIWSFTGTRII